MEFSQKIKNRNTIWSNNSIYGDLLKVCIKRWMGKMWSTWIISHKEDWNLVICDNMDGPRGFMLRKVSQIEWQVQCDVTCMWKLKTKTNEPAYPDSNVVIDTENKEVVAREERDVVMRELGERDEDLQTSLTKQISFGNKMYTMRI